MTLVFILMRLPSNCYQTFGFENLNQINFHKPWRTNILKIRKKHAYSEHKLCRAADEKPDKSGSSTRSVARRLAVPTSPRPKHRTRLRRYSLKFTNCRWQTCLWGAEATVEKRYVFATHGASKHTSLLWLIFVGTDKLCTSGTEVLWHWKKKNTQRSRRFMRRF